ncbi:MAG: N-acetylglucosamine-6-phosphate deacetylase [Mycetocola sp.]
MPTIIHSVQLISAGTVTPNAWVLFDEGKVGSVGTGRSWRGTDSAAHATVVDGDGMTLTPGFVDLHCHGGAGISLSDPGAVVADALAPHRRAGTTRSVLSLATPPPESLPAHLAECSRAAQADPGVLGVHLEGPFLSPEKCGAHDLSALQLPTPERVDQLLESANGGLSQITIAPELPGALDAISRFRDAGVVVAIGHTTATSEQTTAAIDAGATLITHALNAMPQITSREPGPVGAALARPGVTLELINDGVHLHDHTARLLLAAAAGRIAFVSDALAATGATDGDYLLGVVPYRVEQGVARRPTGALAGATSTLDVALRRAVSELGMSLVDAVDAITVVPATVLGQQSRIARIAPGYVADAVLLNAELGVRGVWADGVRLR